MEVRIKAGTRNGQRIRLKSRGGPGRNGGPPGDLYISVHVAPHAVFGRRGNDLTITVPVTYAEAGVDFISSGALTHSASAVDLSMRIVAES